MNMEIRPKKLLGKTIFIEFSNWIEHKADCYWHFISLNEKENSMYFHVEITCQNIFVRKIV